MVSVATLRSSPDLMLSMLVNTLAAHLRTVPVNRPSPRTSLIIPNGARAVRRRAQSNPKFVVYPPIWRPNLTLPSLMKTGALHPRPVRHVAAPPPH